MAATFGPHDPDPSLRLPTSLQERRRAAVVIALVAPGSAGQLVRSLRVGRGACAPVRFRSR